MQDKSRKNSYLYLESQIDRFYHLFEEFFSKIKEDAEQKAKEEKKQRRINYWLLFVNFVIVICTIVIVFKTISAVSISRENLNKFKEFTKKNNRAYLSIGEASFQKSK